MPRPLEESGACCTARHATATPPWTCECPCHHRAPQPLYPSPCCGVESQPDVHCGTHTTLMSCGQCGLVWKP